MTNLKSRLLNGTTIELEKDVERIWALTVIMDQPSTGLRFVYNDEVRAGAAYDALSSNAGPPAPEIKDDYGSTARIRRDRILVLNLSDYAREKDGIGEIAMIDAHKQAELQRRAASDPKLQAGSGLLKPQITELPIRRQ